MSTAALPGASEASDEKRLWIGNLDTRLSEYRILKVLQKYGTISKFDFLFHKSGPLQGQPRGYCFVTYDTRDQAEEAIKSLDGQKALSKNLSVKWAHLKAEEEDERGWSAPAATPGTVQQTESDVSLSTKIRAIEAKLKMMEENKDSDVHINIRPPVVTNQAQTQNRNKSTRSFHNHGRSQNRRNQRPYYRSRK